MLVVALLALGFAAPLIRVAGAPALAIAVWRTALAWPVLAAVALARREQWPWARALPAGLFLAVHWVCWILAVQTTLISTAALLVCTGTLWAALLSGPLLGERVGARQWMGLVLALLGIALVLLPGREAGGPHTLVGDLLALAAALAWVGYMFIGRRARQRAGFWGYTATVYLAAAVTVAAVALVWGVPLLALEPRGWAAVAGLAALPTLLGHGGLNYLLRHMGPVRLGLWTLVEPVLATLAAWPLFGEVPTVLVVVGGAATLLGVALGQQPTRRADSAPGRRG